MKYTEFLEMETYAMLDYITNNFYVTLPESILTVDDMQAVGPMLSKLINGYTFLSNLGEYAKIMVREKKGKVDKDTLQSLMGKRDILLQAADTTKMQYSALSRMITVKQEINYELRMSEAR